MDAGARIADRREWAMLAALIVVVAWFYVWRLDRAPVYPGHDEIQFGVQAYAIATTGADLEGRRFPVFFRDRAFPDYGRDPLSIYWTAVVLKLLPFSETSIRLAGVAVGLLDVVLVYFVARRLFKSRALALGAAAMTGFAPSHLFYSRVALEILYPLPFVLVWLYLLIEFEERGRRSTLWLAAFVLGLSVYAHKSAEAVAPAYLLLTCVLAWGWARDRAEGFARAGLAIAGFFVALIPFALAFLRHPERFGGVIKTYGVYDPNLNPAQGLRDVLRYGSIGDRLGAYWDSFNPQFLFFAGDGSLSDSSRNAGVFLLPTIVLVALGAWAAATSRARINLAIVGGVLLAPVPALIDPEVWSRRMIYIVPFAALTAMLGAEWLVARYRHGRLAVAVIALLSAAHLAFYYADYHTTYRVQSAVWFESNLPGVFERLMAIDDARGGTDRIIVDIENPYAADYGQFYAIKHDRAKWSARIAYRKVADADVAAPGIVLVRQVTAETLAAPCAHTAWPLRQDTIVHNEGGAPAFAICTNP